jgi:hypothetical protein
MPPPGGKSTTTPELDPVEATETSLPPARGSSSSIQEAHRTPSLNKHIATARSSAPTDKLTRACSGLRGSGQASKCLEVPCHKSTHVRRSGKPRRLERGRHRASPKVARRGDPAIHVQSHSDLGVTAARNLCGVGSIFVVLAGVGWCWQYFQPSSSRTCTLN